MTLALLYHDVVDGDDDASGFRGGGASRYKLGRDEFRSHLDAVGAAAQVAPSILPQSYTSRPNSHKHPLILTFDDGGLSAATVIADELERRGWHGHFFITVDYIGTPGFVDRGQIRDLARRGHRIGSHSCSHPTRMANCSRIQLLDEWRRSRAVLSEILGEPVTSASVPGGYYARRVAEAASEEGYTHLFNSEPTTRVSSVQNCHVLGRYTIYRGMAPEQAAAIAAGSSVSLFKQSAAWKGKKILKTLGGPAYLVIRKRLLDRKYQSRNEHI